MHIFFRSLIILDSFFDSYMASFSSDCVIHFHNIENGKWVSNASMLCTSMLWLIYDKSDDNDDVKKMMRNNIITSYVVVASISDIMLVFDGWLVCVCVYLYMYRVDKTRCQELFKYYVGFNGAFCFFRLFHPPASTHFATSAVGTHCFSNICASVTL